MRACDRTPAGLRRLVDLLGRALFASKRWQEAAGPGGAGHQVDRGRLTTSTSLC